MEQKSNHGKGSKVGRQGEARERKNARLMEAKERISARNKAARIQRHLKMHRTDGTAKFALNRLVNEYGKTVLKRRVK
jgi:hypothetical protein